MKIKLGNIKGPKGDPGPMGPQGPRGEAGNGAAIPKTEQLLKDQNYLFNGGLDDLLYILVKNNVLFNKPAAKLNFEINKDNKTISFAGTDGFTVEITPKGERTVIIKLSKTSSVPVSAIGVKEIKLVYKNLNGTTLSEETIPANLNQFTINYNGQTARKDGDTATIITDWANFPDGLIIENKSFFNGVKKLNFVAENDLSSNYNLQSLKQTSIKEIYLPAAFSGNFVIPYDMEITIINGENTEKIYHKSSPGSNDVEVNVSHGVFRFSDIITRGDFVFYKSNGLDRRGNTFWLTDTSR